MTSLEKENLLCSIRANGIHITCSICKQSQPATNFSIYAQRAASITRCRTCSVACSECLRPCTSARMFATGTSICWKCFKAPRTCSRCQRQLSIHIKTSEAEKLKYLVCTACYNQGYRNDNIDEIPCREGHNRGTAAFDQESIRHWKTRQTVPLCVSCKLQKYVTHAGSERILTTSISTFGEMQDSMIDCWCAQHVQR